MIEAQKLSPGTLVWSDVIVTGVQMKIHFTTLMISLVELENTNRLVDEFDNE